VGVENFCTKLPKGTPLRQVWSNKSFGVCGSDVVLTLESDEKVRENRHWKLDVVYNTTSLPRRRDTRKNAAHYSIHSETIHNNTLHQCYFSWCFSVSVTVSVLYVRNIMFDSQIQSIIKLIVHFQKCSVN